MATLVDDWVETTARTSQPGGALSPVAAQNGDALAAAAAAGVPPIFSLEPFDQQFARSSLGGAVSLLSLRLLYGMTCTCTSLDSLLAGCC